MSIYIGLVKCLKYHLLINLQEKDQMRDSYLKKKLFKYCQLPHYISQTI